MADDPNPPPGPADVAGPQGGTFGGGPPAANNNDFLNQFFQWLQSTAGGGGMGGGFGGANPMAGMADALGLGGMGGMGDPLGMGGMINPMGGNIGLNPYQAAGLRLRRGNEMNALRQRMANQHRAIGPAGGRDYSRHVQNIDDEIMALQEAKVQDNVKNALAYNQQLMQYGQQNLANNMKLFEALGGGQGRLLRYGGSGEESPGTFSGGEETQGAS